MSALDLSDDDLALLNSKLGLKHLLEDNEIDPAEALRRTRCELELSELQEELVGLQNWVIENGHRVVVIFEGRDAAGKGGAIRRITSHINPRHYQIYALPKPSAEERGQWYFQRYVSILPKPGEMVFFDRSWYNRAMVEPVNGFCSKHEYATFMGQVNGFENMLVESGTTLIKFYFSISKKEQQKRFKAIAKDPLKRWKLTSVDQSAQKLWSTYTKYKQDMLEKTNTEQAPWMVIDANDKYEARLAALRHILATVPWSSDD
ncbi:MAG: polyphosphate kinase 2 [Planctomycetota bacterium]|jgi:polyphosphate kinase 2|nr:polyphosphate kinase 2 [Planctomycetota bacterium]